MGRPLVRVDGEWRIRPRKAAIPGVRLTQMRQAFLSMDDSEILNVARIVLGHKIKKTEVHLVRDRMLTWFEERAA